MKFRNTMQLGALLVLLVVAYFGVQKLNMRSAQQIQEAKRIFDFAPEDIREITVDRLEEPPTVGRQSDSGEWSITEPHPSIRPNALLWDRVAEHTAGLMNERSLPEDALDLETYGLAIPRLTVGVEVKGREHTLNFGYLEPTQTFRYARLDDGPVFLVKKDAVFELDRPLDLLRDAFVVEAHDSPVLLLEFARIMTVAELERMKKLPPEQQMENPPPPGTESDVSIIVERPSAEEPWVQLSPVHTAANQEKVEELVKEIQFARGRNYVDAPESFADFGLDPASARISIENEAAGRQTFYFGDLATNVEGGGVYVRKEGEEAVFVVDAHITQLFPRHNALRERRLLTRQAKAMERVEFQGGDTAYTLARDSEGFWKMTEPPLDDTDSDYVSSYLSAIKSLEVTRFYPEGPAAYGLDQPEARLRFHFTGEDAPVEIRLTPNTDEPEYYYAMTDAGEVGGIPAEHIQFLLAGAHQFRHMSLLRFPVNRATAMQLQINGVEYALQKEHNRWLVTSPENYFMPNQQDAATLLTTVAGLRALGAEESLEEDPAVYGFETPRFRISVTLAPEVAGGAAEVLGPLEVGAVVPGIDQQRFARSSERSGVFRINQSFIETVEGAAAGIRKSAGSTRAGN